MLTATDSATGAAVVDDVLAGEMFDDLASDVQNFISTFDAGYQPPSVPGSLSSGTFWMPSERIYAPLNAVEQFVAAMSYSPFWGRFGISSQAFLGAEWWLQDVAKEEEPKVFHTDCDTISPEGCECEMTLFAHPILASVFYLDNVGGATALFGQTRKHEREIPRLHPRVPHEVVTVHPRRNRLLLFEGDRYHAVLHPSQPHANTKGQRVGQGCAISRRVLLYFS